MATSKKAKKSLRSRRFTDEQRTLVQSGTTLERIAKGLARQWGRSAAGARQLKQKGRCWSSLTSRVMIAQPSCVQGRSQSVELDEFEFDILRCDDRTSGR